MEAKLKEAEWCPTQNILAEWLLWPAAPVLCSLQLHADRMTRRQTHDSDKCSDQHHAHWRVMSPRELAKQAPKTHLVSEKE